MEMNDKPLEDQPERVPLSINISANSEQKVISIEFNIPIKSLHFDAFAAADFNAVLAKAIATVLAPPKPLIQVPAPGDVDLGKKG